MFPQYEYRNTPIYVDRRRPLKPCPIRFHTHIEALLITEGQACITVGGKRWTLGEGDLYLAFPNVPHGVDSAEGSAIVLIADIAQHPAFHETLIHKLPSQPVLRKGEFAPTVYSIFERMHTLPKDAPHRQTVLSGYTMALLGELLCATALTDRNVDDALLHKLILFLLENYTRDIDLEETAKALGYSKFYISRLISAAFGTNFRTLLNTYRISMAQTLLVSSTRSVSQIADACGFKNQSSFNRVFLQQCAVTPSQYRREIGPMPEKPMLYIR